MPKPHPKLASRIKTKGGVIHDTLTGYDFRVDEPMTPRRTIRAKCLECQCGSSDGVRDCEIYDCANWPHRSGKSPHKRPDAKAPPRP